MLELNVKPKQIDGITPTLYDTWYCSDKRILKYIEYHRRPLKIMEAINYSPGLRVLDVGCNWGYLLMWIKHKFPDTDCYGIDITDEDIKFGNKLASYNGYKINLEYGNANNLPYEDEFFDYIVSTETFEHFLLSDRMNILRECNRVLKPEGYLLMTTPNKNGLAEIVKQFLGRFDLARKLITALPHPSLRKSFVPIGATKGDCMTCVAESTESLRKKVETAGFTIVNQDTFIFMPEITPNFLFDFLSAAEIILERLKIFNSFATTQYIVSKKMKHQ